MMKQAQYVSVEREVTLSTRPTSRDRSMGDVEGPVDFRIESNMCSVLHRGSACLLHGLDGVDHVVLGNGNLTAMLGTKTYLTHPSPCFAIALPL